MWKRVVAPVLAISILWITSSAISTYWIQRVYESHSRVLTENVAAIRAAWAMQDTLWRLHAIVMESGAKERRETRIEATELETAFQRYVADAERISFTSQEQVAIRAIREHFVIYRDHIEARLRSAGIAGSLTSPPAQAEKTIRLARAVAEPCRELVELNERMLADSTAESTRLGSLVNIMRLTFLITGLIVGVICGLWIARGLHRSISQISVTLNDVTGDLNREVGSVEIRSFGDLPALHQQVQAVATRIRQVVEELQQARHQALLTERLAAVGELAAGVAHELRNPLTSVKLLIQTAAQRQPNATLAGRQLQVVQQEIARMEGTIQSLLDFARPPELHEVAHDLRTTVRRAINLVEGRAKQQNVAIVEEIPDTTVIVNGDPEQLHQIVVNLLLNGIEAMPQGGALTVGMNVDDAERRTCRVSVSDTGEGIPEPILERVFEPFATSKEHGTGLGLPISRRIAEEHGGLLLAANRAEGGAIFTLVLHLDVRDANAALSE